MASPWKPWVKPSAPAITGASCQTRRKPSCSPRIWIPPIAVSAITGPLATCVFHLQMNDPASAVASGMGTCGLVGQIGVYAGWVADVASGAKAAITGFDWLGLILISFVIPAVLTPLFGEFLRRIGWIKEGDLKLS